MILIDPLLRAEQSSETGRLPSARSLARFLAEAQSAVRLKGEVNVLLTTDANQRALNRRFRGKNKTTDVLSFPAFQINAKEKIAGDLSISLPVARHQADEQGHSHLTEIKVLILHGLLHLSGHDHETDSGEMANKEEKLRARLALPNGLIERVEGKVAPKKIAARKKNRAKKAGGDEA
jgi:probable rRNA maturation factor